MNTKFILDKNLRDEDLYEIKNILDSIKVNPPLFNQRANFLKTFTLAAINTFRKDYHPQIKDIKIDVHELKPIPFPAPEKIKLSIDLFDAPNKIDMPLDLFLNAPDKLDIPRELLMNAPRKNLF